MEVDLGVLDNDYPDIKLTLIENNEMKENRSLSRSDIE